MQPTWTTLQHRGPNHPGPDHLVILIASSGPVDRRGQRHGRDRGRHPRQGDGGRAQRQGLHNGLPCP